MEGFQRRLARKRSSEPRAKLTPRPLMRSKTWIIGEPFRLPPCQSEQITTLPGLYRVVGATTIHKSARRQGLTGANRFRLLISQLLFLTAEEAAMLDHRRN